MSRNFSTTEKILIGVLVAILVGLFYYYFVDQRVRSTIEASEAEYNELSSELEVMEGRLNYLQSVQASMDDMEAGGMLSYMGSYNNSKAEVTFLNDILSDTLQYTVSFSNVTRSGDQVRRSFTLQYTTASYKAARDIMIRLLEGKNRCLVGDVRCTISTNGTVSMTQSATFYETMVGGVPDAGLPANSATANS